LDETKEKIKENKEKIEEVKEKSEKRLGYEVDSL